MRRVCQAVTQALAGAASTDPSSASVSEELAFVLNYYKQTLLGISILNLLAARRSIYLIRARGCALNYYKQTLLGAQFT